MRNKQLTGEQLEDLFNELRDSPLMTSLIVLSIEKKYLDPSGLEEQEKTDGRIALRRFVRGMIDQQISEGDFEAAMAKIADKQPNNEWVMRETVSDEELRELIQFVKDKSDAADIPEEVEEVDVSDEMRRIIDSALGENNE